MYQNNQNNGGYGQPQGYGQPAYGQGQYQQVPQQQSYDAYGNPVQQQQPPNAQYQQQPPQQNYQQPYSYPQGSGGADLIIEQPGNKKNYNMSQDEVSDQMKFVRKVYCILASQLTLTAAFIAIVQVSDKMKAFFASGTGLGLSITAGIMSIVFMCMIVCCFRKTTPHNYILLFLFTICESYMVGGLTAAYDQKLVILAGLMTALVSISLTIYAMRTKTNIEVFYAMTFVIYLAMLPLLIIGFVMHSKVLNIVYCALALLFYSIFLIIDTMQICKGASFGGYALDLDEYIVGALMLYIDIVMIFVYLLKLLGAARD